MVLEVWWSILRVGDVSKIPGCKNTTPDICLVALSLALQTAG